MKPRLVAAALAAAALAACTPVTTGGAGQTARGQPVSGLVTVDNMKQEYSVQIISPTGWTCTSSFGRSPTPGVMTRTVPLTCSNRARGNLVLTMNQVQNQMVGSFALNNGESGQVTFGNL